MLANFSEFTYGFALTNELIDLSPHIVSVAPVFPSLIEEGRDGGGYDVGIKYSGYPLFIQFKLSEYMMSNTAKEWYVYNAPYYRFAIRSKIKSKQHELLLRLESKKSNVFYAAPLLNTESEINTAFYLKSIVSNSVFIKPSSIGRLPDNKEHRVIFDVKGRTGYFCSEPQKIDIINTTNPNINVLLNSLRKEGETLDNKDSFIELGYDMLKLASETLEDEWKEISNTFLNEVPNKPENVVSYLSRLLFNCDFYIVQKEKCLSPGALKCESEQTDCINLESNINNKSKH